VDQEWTRNPTLGDGALDIGASGGEVVEVNGHQLRTVSGLKRVAVDDSWFACGANGRVYRYSPTSGLYSQDFYEWMRSLAKQERCNEA